MLLGFDIDSCAVGFDGVDVYAEERFRRALCKGYNLVNKSRRSTTYEVSKSVTEHKVKAKNLFRFVCTSTANVDLLLLFLI